MADENSELSLVVKAVDQASATIDNIRNKFGELGVTVGETSTVAAKSVGDIVKEFELAVKETNNLSEAQNLLQESTAKVNAFLEGETVFIQDFSTSVKASAEDITAMSTELTALGGEAEASGGLIDGFATKAEGMLERMAVKMTVIAAVIAAFTYLKDSVTEAEAANKTYTDQFEKSTDAMDRQKVDMGDNFLPALELLKRTWADVTTTNIGTTHQVGLFQEALTTASKFVSQMIADASFLAHTFIDVVKVAIDAVIDSVLNFAKEMGNIGHAIESMMSGDFSKAWTQFTDTSQMSWKTTVTGFKDGVADIKSNFNDLMTETDKITAFKDPTNLSTTPYVKPKSDSGLTNALASATKDYENMKTTVTEDLAQLATEHDKKIEQITGSMDKLAESYATTGAAGVDALDKLKDAHDKASQAIVQSIENVNKSIAKENDSFAQKTASNIDTLAQAFKKASDEITTLQEKLDSWQTPNSIADTQIQITQLQDKLAGSANPAQQSTLELQLTNAKARLQIEQDNDAKAKQAVIDKLTADKAAMDANKDLQVQFASQIAEANENVLQQAVDTFNVKQAQAQKDHDTAIANYQQQIQLLNQKALVENQTYAASVLKSQQSTEAKLQDIREQMAKYAEQQKEEQDLYTLKVKTINELMAKAEEERQKASDATFNKIKSNVEAEIALYTRLAQAMSKAMSANSAQQIGAIPHFAEGGVVTSPTIAMVGEGGEPEAIIPFSKMGGLGGGTTINIINPSVRNDGDLAAMKDMLNRVLRPVLQNAKINYA